MTIDEMLVSNKPTITAAEAGKIIGIAPQYIRIQARKDPKSLGFPVLCVGSHVVIPRLAFLGWLGYTSNKE